MDEWGGIDKKIKDLVLALNELGIPTTGSCEGHIDHGAPAPWVKITPSSKKENQKLKKRISTLLKNFYATRVIESDIQFTIEDGVSGFWLHNGGSAFKSWRKKVNQRAEAIRNDKTAKEVVSVEEQKKRKEKLSPYQEEVKKLSTFLRQFRKN